MSRICAQALLLIAIGNGCVCAAQTGGQSHAPQLKMVVVLSRHGVRSPTWTQARLDSYSALPWPKWSVPPGNLTVRGHGLIRQFGSYDRASFAEAGLFGTKGCADAGSTYLWADSDQRTIETGQALAEGLFPGCAVPLHGHTAGENDPLFHPAANGVKPAEADAALAELSARLKAEGDESQRAALIDQLRKVLKGCDPLMQCKPVREPEMALDNAPMQAVRGKGDHMVDLQGPLAQASTFSEDFLLEYADGMPMAQVGWGKMDAAELSKLLALHSDYFELIHRTPAIARVEASNMLFHIAQTLAQHVAGKPDADAVGPVESRLVMLAGHDTNLAAVASLLGVHWDIEGRHDDTPPGTELAFELWQDERGAYTVRVAVAMQTLQQLREMPELTLKAPPARERLTLPGCAATDCTWDAFQKIVRGAIDTTDVVPMPPK